MEKTSDRVREAGLILGALGVIGFIGIVWLMIYGNLSGNLGFAERTESESFFNETITVNGVFATPATAESKPNPSLSNLFITNATCIHDGNDSIGCEIASGNYTVVGAAINVSLTSEFLALSNEWNVTATVNYDGSGRINTENVISNVTSGFASFFEFSETFFVIAAIVLLIFMLVGLLTIVMLIAKKQGGEGKGFT